MAFTEPNLHSRNLKFISILFIAYWALALEPEEGRIQLLFMGFKIGNPDALVWLAHAILFYFAWRFYLNSKGRVKYGFYNTIRTDHLTSGNIGHFFYEKLKIITAEDYENNHKIEFQKKRDIRALELKKDLTNNTDYHINLLEIKFENDKLCLCYQVEYDGYRLPEFYFGNFELNWTGFYSKLFKARKLVAFLTSKEDTPDFLMPWVLFFVAILTRIYAPIEGSVKLLCSRVLS